jgi:fluoroquinolone resistance protein
MDAENPPFTEQSYEDRHFASISCQDAEVKEIEFFQCRFDGGQFLRTTFRQCRFEDCVFEKCDLSLLKVPESSFIGVRFVTSKMLGIDWTQATTPLTLFFQGSNINHSIFVWLSLQRMEMVECVAREVDFTGTNLTRAKLGKTDFLGSRFLDTNLSYADFSKAVNYAIDPRANRLKKTVFSMPEAVSLLSAFDIVLK